MLTDTCSPLLALTFSSSPLTGGVRTETKSTFILRPILLRFYNETHYQRYDILTSKTEKFKHEKRIWLVT